MSPELDIYLILTNLILRKCAEILMILIKKNSMKLNFKLSSLRNTLIKKYSSPCVPFMCLCLCIYRHLFWQLMQLYEAMQIFI